MSAVAGAVSPRERWPGTDDLPYPRADPADLDRLPGDTVGTARLPVGVRLEFVGTAEALELDYQTQTDDLGYRGEGAGTTFTLVTGDETVAVPAHLGSGSARFALSRLARRDPDQPLVVYLPEGMRPASSPSRAKPASSRPRRGVLGGSRTATRSPKAGSRAGRRARGRPSRRDDTDSTW